MIAPHSPSDIEAQQQQQQQTRTDDEGNEEKNLSDEECAECGPNWRYGNRPMVAVTAVADSCTNASRRMLCAILALIVIPIVILLSVWATN